MGRIYKQKRSSFWWIDYVDTKRQRVSTRNTSKKNAAEQLTLRESEVLRGEVVGPRANRTTYEVVRDNLLGHYKTTGRWKNLADAAIRFSYLSRKALGGFQSGFGGMRMTAITPAVVRAYCSFRLAEPVRNHHICKPPEGHATCHMCRLTSKATVNRELAFLRRMPFKLGHDEGLVMRIPRIELLEEAPARGGFVDEAQYNSLLPHLRPDLRVVVAIGYRLGWRVRSEVLTLEKHQLDLDAGTVRLNPGKTKNKEGRTVHLPSDLVVMLRKQLARVTSLESELKRDVPYVFPHLTGGLKGRRVESFTKEWKKATGRAGLAGLLVHDLRRSCVRNMERLSVPRSVAMKITGHRTESVYRRYAIVSDSDMREAALRLGPPTAPEPALVETSTARVPWRYPRRSGGF